MEIASDRRQKRTHIRQLALQYQLERSVADFALNSIAIADQDGFLLASSDNTNFSEALAAYAPLLSTSGSWDSETVEASLQSENPMVRWPDITIRPFRASGVYSGPGIPGRDDQELLLPL